MLFLEITTLPGLIFNNCQVENIFNIDSPSRLHMTTKLFLSVRKIFIQTHFSLLIHAFLEILLHFENIALKQSEFEITVLIQDEAPKG